MGFQLFGFYCKRKHEDNESRKPWRVLDVSDQCQLGPGWTISFRGDDCRGPESNDSEQACRLQELCQRRSRTLKAPRLDLLNRSSPQPALSNFPPPSSILFQVRCTASVYLHIVLDIVYPTKIQYNMIKIQYCTVVYYTRVAARRGASMDLGSTASRSAHPSTQHP